MGRRLTAYVAAGVVSVVLVALLVGLVVAPDGRGMAPTGPSDGSDAVQPHTPAGSGACPRRRDFFDDRSGTVLPPGAAVLVTWCTGPDRTTIVGPKEELRSRRAIDRLTSIANLPGSPPGCGDASGLGEFGLAFTYPDGTVRLVRTTHGCPARLQVGTRSTFHAGRMLRAYAAAVALARRGARPPSAEGPLRCARGEQVLGQFRRTELVAVLGLVTRARLCPSAGSTTLRARDLTDAELDWLRTATSRAASDEDLGALRAVVVATTGWGDRLPIAIHERSAIALIGRTLRAWPLPATLRGLP